jgi:alanine racemase
MSTLAPHSLHSWLEISAAAFTKNITTYKRLIGPAHLGIVIKGNAYGHGIDEIVTLAKGNKNIAWYLTFSLSEALYLRSLDVRKPILVMGIIDQDPLLAFKENIRLIFHQHEQFADFERAKQHNLKPIIHLKVDTGLGRYGFYPQECLEVIDRLRMMPHITLEGIFTHFARAELLDQSYTELQTKRFSTVLQELQLLASIPYSHSHATSAILFRGIEQHNLCRIGAGLYGLWPSREIQSWGIKNNIMLTQVLTWKTRILHIKTVAAGTPIGYGCSFIAPRTMRLGILPIGYADGYPRNLSNTGNVFINNRLAPVIGRIGMNSTTIDISNIPDAQVRSETILTGPQQGITALDVAYAAGSFNPRDITVGIKPQQRIIVF